MVSTLNLEWCNCIASFCSKLKLLHCMCSERPLVVLAEIPIVAKYSYLWMERVGKMLTEKEN